MAHPCHDAKIVAEVHKEVKHMKDRISLVIKERKITKTEFAKRLNVSQAFVSQMCSGAARPSDRTIADICREFPLYK